MIEPRGRRATTAGVIMGVLCFGTCRFDRTTGVLRVRDNEVWLPPKGLKLLHYLLQKPGVVVSRAELLDAIWEGRAVTDHCLTEAVRIVRWSLGDDPRDPTYIQTIHRRGYRFVAAVHTERTRPAVQTLPARAPWRRHWSPSPRSASDQA